MSEEDRVGASSGLVLTYSAGAMLGPMLGSSGMSLPRTTPMVSMIEADAQEHAGQGLSCLAPLRAADWL